jgi:DNA-binding PadR family transcriptional regulator
MSTRPVRDRSGSVARIALLGVLARGPAHGYEVQATLKRWDMDWWADVQTGSIYAGLRKLETEGHVEVIETAQHGKRPVHRVYAITDAGREAFRELLRTAWGSVTRYSRPIDLAVSFYYELPREEIVALLEHRLGDLAALEAVFAAEVDVPLGRIQRSIVPDLRDHELRLIRAEIDWTKQLVKRLGRYEWTASPS